MTATSRTMHTITSRRAGRRGPLAAVLLAAAVSGWAAAPVWAGESDGVIDIWYGTTQRFGHLGNPQRWVNILGNASDPDGIASLTYSLNGGPQRSLGVGPDTRRLQRPGDFNVEIDSADLLVGDNTVVITLTDTLGHETLASVTVQFDNATVWPENYSIDWSHVGALDEAVVVVDGKWTLTADGPRPAEPGYDRILAIGDITWDNYEAVVPVTIHAIDPNGFNWPSVAPGLGVMLRWQGHTQWGNWQPNIGYLPQGGTIWYDWGDNGGRLKLFGDDGLNILDNSGRHLDFDIEYIFKIRAQTQPGEGTLYSAKVWEATRPEPDDWDFSGLDGPGDLTSGSMLLIAHHVDATFGNVTVTALPDPDALVISDVSIDATATMATVSWRTTPAADARVSWGTTSNYELGSLTDPNLATTHSVTISGLSPDTLYYLQIEGTDSDDNGATYQATFQTDTPDLSGIVSDDFRLASLDPNVWTVIDAVGDGTWQLTGTQLVLSVPPGSDHSMWANGNRSLRVIQPAGDVDFEIEAAFESAVSERYQQQGILIEQDQDDYLRLEFYSDGTATWLLAVRFAAGVPTIRYNQSIPSGVPMYLRVSRGGDTWTLGYSLDGQTWHTAASFDEPLAVGAVGVYAADSADDGATPPGHQAVVDYFFNTASPLVPEDGWLLTMQTQGSGQVAATPARQRYEQQQTVTLTAQPAGGWSFYTWQGDVSGADNPASLVMAADRNVTAVFVNDNCPGDLNLDGQVDLADVALILVSYGSTGVTRLEGDLDADGDVDLSDLARLLVDFEQPCE